MAKYTTFLVLLALTLMWSETLAQDAPPAGTTAAPGLVEQIKETVGKVTEGVSNTVKKTTDEVKDTLAKTTEGIKDTISKTTSAVGDAVTKTKEKVVETVKSIIPGKK